MCSYNTVLNFLCMCIAGSFEITEFLVLPGIICIQLDCMYFTLHNSLYDSCGKHERYRSRCIGR